MTLTHKIYAVYDLISGHFPMLFQSQSDGLACRTALSTMRFPIRDTQLYHLGECTVEIADLESTHIDFSNVSFSWNDSPRLVSWESYKFPEDVAEALAPLNLSHDEIVEISRRKIESMVSNKEGK